MLTITKTLKGGGHACCGTSISHATAFTCLPLHDTRGNIKEADSHGARKIRKIAPRGFVCITPRTLTSAYLMSGVLQCTKLT